MRRADDNEMYELYLLYRFFALVHTYMPSQPVLFVSYAFPSLCGMNKITLSVCISEVKLCLQYRDIFCIPELTLKIDVTSDFFYLYNKTKAN